MIDHFKDDYRWLSNFWPVPITAFGRGVDSVEHGYQAAKARDSTDRVAILIAPTAGKAKRLGKDLEKNGLIRSDWDSIKEMVMRTLLRRKYYSNFEMKKKLLDTGIQLLIEGNDWKDTYWGCVREKLSTGLDLPTERRISPARGWVGLNRLGELTMEVRREIVQLDGL
jgi:ribA/ribD-fused uncharacterized protein